MTCLEDGVVSSYIGETHRTLWDRMIEHESGNRNKERETPLGRHWIEHHPNRDTPPETSHEVISKHHTSTQRQIWEAIKIDAEDCDNLMNNKSEWRQNSIPRMVLEKRDHQDETPSQERRPETPQVISGETSSGRDDSHSDFGSQYIQRKRRRKENEERQRQMDLNLGETKERHQENFGSTAGPTGVGEGVKLKIFSLGKDITSMMNRQSTFGRQRKRQGRRKENGDIRETETAGRLVARGQKRQNRDMF